MESPQLELVSGFCGSYWWRFEDVGDGSPGEEQCLCKTYTCLKSECCFVAQSCNAHEHVNDQRRHDLNDGGVLGVAEEVAKLEVLLDPLEEEFDLPAPLIKLCDLGCGAVEIIADKRDCAATSDHSSAP
jgi:hypothetical protein